MNVIMFDKWYNNTNDINTMLILMINRREHGVRALRAVEQRPPGAPGRKLCIYIYIYIWYMYIHTHRYLSLYIYIYICHDDMLIYYIIWYGGMLVTLHTQIIKHHVTDNTILCYVMLHHIRALLAVEHWPPGAPVTNVAVASISIA